jgi:uncharacterized membrane protein
MVGVVRLAVEAAAANSRWMMWNLALAMVPLALAAVLFARPVRRGVAWWVGVVAFLAFLPNAPYVLTDVVHLADDARTSSSDAVVSALVPQYGLFFLVGFEAYVLSLLLVGRHLRSVGRVHWIVPVEVGLHLMCAIGIHLGRFDRLNTWDVVARPDLLWRGLGGMSPLLVVVAFVAVATAYAVMKRITVALIAYRPSAATA